MNTGDKDLDFKLLDYLPTQSNRQSKHYCSFSVVVMNTGDKDLDFKLLDYLPNSKQAAKQTALAHSIQTYMYS